MNNNRLKELIEKYLEGRATDEEQQQVEEWYASFEGSQGLMEQLDGKEQDAFGSNLYDSINRDIAHAAGNRPPVSIRYMRWIAAAGIVLFIGLTAIWLNRRNTGARTDITTITARAESGVIKKIILPDSSTLWLNAGSSIRFTQDRQKQGKREAWLEGEGCFDVAQQPDHPFIVHAGKVSVNVLGTRFNVEAYDPRKTVAVTVSTGKVAVGDADRMDHVLAGNEQVIYDAPARHFTRNAVAAKDVMAWTGGQLVFKKMTFRDIAEKLERRYNARIRFENATVANRLLTASFDSNVPLEDVLSMLCRIYGCSFRRDSAGNSFLVLE